MAASITRVQANDLLVQSNELQVLRQSTVSCEPKICELRVFDIASQRVVSVSLFELQANKFAIHKSASLRNVTFKLSIWKASSQPIKI